MFGLEKSQALLTISLSNFQTCFMIKGVCKDMQSVLGFEISLRDIRCHETVGKGNKKKR
jgi:hypothetical protein